MTAGSPSEHQGRWTGWLPGFVLGAIDAVGLLEVGVFGVAFTALTILLIAWKGPRSLALAGLVSGAGAVWTILFARVMLSCAADQGCEAGDIGTWVAISGAILAVGLIATFAVARRSVRRD